ncbi:MAG TPA: hypothetical protein VMA34_16475 [Terracidiphilus sp.]|nr:hypothetical protein [Bryobacteraceae bacterium]HUA99931.1 hypothetical protein [Terracidiphilus sp.]
MQTQRTRVFITAMTMACALSLHAQQTREQAVKGMRKVLPSEMDLSYTRPAPFAQKLVNHALARHPEILLMAIHAQPPGHGNVIVASDFGRIGKRGDEDDMRCIHTGKPNLEVNGPHFEDELALKDAAGRTVGALGVVFNYKPGEDKERLIRIANEVAREMQRQLPDAARLFGPA